MHELNEMRRFCVDLNLLSNTDCTVAEVTVNINALKTAMA